MWIVIAGWLASVLVFSAFFMKTMVPLRLIAIASNVAFMIYALLGLRYGDFGRLYPIFILHACLLPVNLFRLHQLRRLLRAISEACNEHALQALVPFMKLQQHGDGEVLFHKGDPADRLYLLQHGVVVLPELGLRLAPGAVFGEVGLLSSQGARAASAICEGDCRLATIDRQRAIELTYQNPEFATFLLRLLAGYVADESATMTSDGTDTPRTELPILDTP